ncbi:Site-specific recombinase XerD [Alteromonadaceae bacterium Bs31]|nr:Site-specific recombinase XerD [Alteromonadaceae bacterium Bs31]
MVSAMSVPVHLPLYPTYEELLDFSQSAYPELEEFLSAGPSWRKQHWQWGSDFLKYIGRNKSEHTYLRFRTDVERFLLWTFLFKDKPIDEQKKKDILAFADFAWKPPVNWVGVKNVDRFECVGGTFKVNRDWHPFRYKVPKSSDSDKIDKRRYKPSQATLSATFAALMSFYNYLITEEICIGNPAQFAKKDCRYFIKDAQVKDIKRLTEEQWSYVLATAEKMAENTPHCERNLFVVACLKTLFLRISELSERKTWVPVMSHFWQDDGGNWWLKVFGKGRKLRDVTVPTQFLAYLTRYRKFRGETALPSSSDDSPLVEKIRGQGGMSARHLSRLVQSVFDQAYEQMKQDVGEAAAKKLQEASTHWLRHTGASLEVERGRPLKDISEDLGHASMATTDTIYVQSENKKRAASGKERSVD